VLRGRPDEGEPVTPSNRRRGHGEIPERVTRPDILPAGIADICELPRGDFSQLWESIIVDPHIKSQLLSQAIFNFTVRPKASRARLPLHGIILLVGPPGTGKTSLAKGLATRAAQALGESRGFRFVEVDPHALTSSSLGKTQRAVTELFAGTIVEQVRLGPTIVLLDEVETIVADRMKLSLEANPIDVHRATDAALVQLDQLAHMHKDLLFVATSNFEGAIDQAFVSRADLVMAIPLPNREARLAILRDTLGEMAIHFRAISDLVADSQLEDVAEASEGLDGRAVRKLVAAACTRDKLTALDPSRLTVENLLAAAHAATRVLDHSRRTSS
jgi:SpoVK/Ycf46/Vps4 family AAA+-type ATPase